MPPTYAYKIQGCSLKFVSGGRFKTYYAFSPRVMHETAAVGGGNQSDL